MSAAHHTDTVHTEGEARLGPRQDVGQALEKCTHVPIVLRVGVKVHGVKRAEPGKRLHVIRAHKLFPGALKDLHARALGPAALTHKRKRIGVRLDDHMAPGRVLLEKLVDDPQAKANLEHREPGLLAVAERRG